MSTAVGQQAPFLQRPRPPHQFIVNESNMALSNLLTGDLALAMLMRSELARSPLALIFPDVASLPEEFTQLTKAMSRKKDAVNVLQSFLSGEASLQPQPFYAMPQQPTAVVEKKKGVLEKLKETLFGE
ncbi:MAG: hypothetical protein ACP5IE_01380 [Infirmifilum sp.]